ncbi:hypothetical protein VTK73DRAFT_913 [Phialemonium thermophilum]|uniref:Zn(2)-C6 fungal-type domain-containing protein n=1 Tax=Phialemonium thermophilum TaxID=223376 RepID=A0ABR3XCR7_9PEZI
MQPLARGDSRASPEDATTVRRAAKACSTCHARKTRCDVLETGVPCTKCRDHGFRCSIEPRKKRRTRLGPRHPVEAASTLPAPRVALPEHVMRHQIPHYSFFRNLTPLGRSSLHASDKDRGLILPIIPRDPSACVQDRDARAEDLRFLKQKNVFELPAKAVLDKCISAYFRFFHPFFPVVDRPFFLEKYSETDTDALLCGQGPSLLLLHAIIFTACAFLSPQHIQDMGFSSRQQARSSFHSRARHLHQLEYEPDDIVTIQALLLMSHHYPSVAEQRHTWFWVYQAIGLAQGAGLHRDSGDTPERKLWVRLWWACLVRDRLIALGTRRPMHINSLDCNVPLPTAADLEEDGDTDEDREVKAMFIDFVKLCHYMEGILSLPCAAPESLRNQAAICESTLKYWLANLSSASHRPNHESLQTTSEPVAALYRTLLHLIHNVVLTTLLQSGGTMYEERLDGPRLPSAELQSVAADSIGLLDDLTRFDLVKYCPTQTVTTILPPLIVQVLLMRCSSDAASYEIAHEGFDTCMTVLDQLGQTYWHAKFYHDFFQLTAPVSSSTVSRTRRPLKATKKGGEARDVARPFPVYEGISSDPVPVVGAQEQPTNAGEIPRLLSHADTSRLGIDETLASETAEDVLDCQSAGPWPGPELALADSDGQVRFYPDWLDDDVLFQSLFPSA